MEPRSACSSDVLQPFDDQVYFWFMTFEMTYGWDFFVLPLWLGVSFRNFFEESARRIKADTLPGGDADIGSQASLGREQVLICDVCQFTKPFVCVVQICVMGVEQRIFVWHAPEIALQNILSGRIWYGILSVWFVVDHL